MSAVLDKSNDVPEGWISLTLAECAEILDSRRIPLNSKERAKRTEGKSQDELYPYYGATGQVDVIDDFIFEGEHLLIGEDGAPFFDKSKNVAYIAKGKFWVNNHAHILKAIKDITSNKYLLYYLNKFNYKGYVGGTTRLKLNQASLKQIPVLLAQHEQQKRIVAKIEELFSHIDAGIEALKKAKQLLKQYRQSVLKAAVTGELTKEWREARIKDDAQGSANVAGGRTPGATKLEPASKLLERILKERRQKWEEQQLEQFKAKGKMPKNDNRKEKYKATEFGSDRFFSEIPNVWAVASIDQLAWDVRYGSSSKTNDDEKGVPVLRMGNIVDGNLDYTDLKYLPTNHDEFPDLLLEDGDLLFNRTNSAELVGKTAVYRDTGRQTSLASYLIRVRVVSGIEPDFVAYFINSSCGKNWIKSCVSQNVGQANVNGTKLKALLLPLPSTEEQKEIVRCVEEKLQSTDRLLSELEYQLLKAEKNKQSILAQIFSGQL